MKSVKGLMKEFNEKNKKMKFAGDIGFVAMYNGDGIDVMCQSEMPYNLLPMVVASMMMDVYKEYGDDGVVELLREANKNFFKAKKDIFGDDDEKNT